MILMIVLTCLNALFTVISCWCASRADTHRILAHQSDDNAGGHALVAKTSAETIMAAAARVRHTEHSEASRR